MSYTYKINDNRIFTINAKISKRVTMLKYNYIIFNYDIIQCYFTEKAWKRCNVIYK